MYAMNGPPRGGEERDRTGTELSGERGGREHAVRERMPESRIASSRRKEGGVVWAEHGVGGRMGGLGQAKRIESKRVDERADMLAVCCDCAVQHVLCCGDDFLVFFSLSLKLCNLSLSLLSEDEEIVVSSEENGRCLCIICLSQWSLPRVWDGGIEVSG